MENNTTSIFEMALNEQSKSYLKETARWGHFLAIVGFILGGLILMGGLAFTLLGSTAFGELLGSGKGFVGTIIGIVYILLGAMYFYPSIKLLRFATGMTKGLLHTDQELVTTSFGNLKSVFRFYGILTIVVLGLYALVFVGAIIFGVATGAS